MATRRPWAPLCRVRDILGDTQARAASSQACRTPVPHIRQGSGPGPTPAPRKTAMGRLLRLWETQQPPARPQLVWLFRDSE